MIYLFIAVVISVIYGVIAFRTLQHFMRPPTFAAYTVAAVEILLHSLAGFIVIQIMILTTLGCIEIVHTLSIWHDWRTTPDTWESELTYNQYRDWYIDAHTTQRTTYNAK